MSKQRGGILSFAVLTISTALLAQIMSGQFPPPSGNVASIATTCGVSGGTITVRGTLSQIEPVNAQTGTTYTIQTSDCASLVTFSNSAAIAVAVPAAGGAFAAGFKFSVKNTGMGTATLTPSSGTIGGASNLVLTSGQGCDITSDGNNWQNQCGAGIAQAGSMFTTAGVGEWWPFGFPGYDTGHVAMGIYCPWPSRAFDSRRVADDH